MDTSTKKNLVVTILSNQHILSLHQEIPEIQLPLHLLSFSVSVHSLEMMSHLSLYRISLSFGWSWGCTGLLTRVKPSLSLSPACMLGLIPGEETNTSQDPLYVLTKVSFKNEPLPICSLAMSPCWSCRTHRPWSLCFQSAQSQWPDAGWKINIIDL